MRIYLIATASALLLAAAIAELFTRLFPPHWNAGVLEHNYAALLLISFAALAINGLVCARLASRRPSARPRARQRPVSARKVRQPSGKREEGAIKWFDPSKGFGFIVRQSGEEIFVHQRHVQLGPDHRRPSLRDGQRVSFQVVRHSKGLQAEQVVPL